jgi:hypothetical protein
MAAGRISLFVFLLCFLAPLGLSAARHALAGPAGDWRSADRGSTGRLPDPAAHPGAIVRVFAARTVRWRGIFAVHCWIVLKAAGAAGYTRYDYTAWGEPIWRNRFVPDGRWFGAEPESVFAADGPPAAAMIPRIEAAVAGFALRNAGDYRVWPGPNSNTFVAAIMEAVPEAAVVLPPTAIGKDFPLDGRWLRLSPDRTGIRLTLGGYLGLAAGWRDGLEVNLLGAVAGLDLRRPALKLPGIGRIGFAP